MKLQHVAQAAGVSVSTVSRVINSSPGIAKSTADMVREAMRTLDYAPTRRRRASASREPVTRRRIAFYILANYIGSTPAYDNLLRGVSAAASKFQLDVHIEFLDDLESAIEQIVQRRLDGLLLHGLCPPHELTRPLHDTPTVWLLGNARRPTWGDQVMPDNAAIGTLAARHLLGRGHHNMLYFGINSGWSMGIRAASFSNIVDEMHGTVTVVNPRLTAPSHDDVDTVTGQLIDAYRAASVRPTGLFVAEDWFLRHVYAALSQAGIKPGTDLDIVSCNNDRHHLQGVNPTPASIDIRFERIAYRSVERLVARMQGDDLDDQLRVMVEPVLIPPPVK